LSTPFVRGPWRRAATILLGLLLLVTGTTASFGRSEAPWSTPELYPLARPGDIFFDPGERRRLLAGLTDDARARYCGVERGGGWPHHGVVRNVTAEEQPAATFALTMMQAGAVALAYDARSARKAIIDNLRRFAKKGAFTRFKGAIDANSFYNLDRTLLPTIVAYGIVRDDPLLAPDERRVVESWLDRLVRKRGPERVVDESRVSSRNNHRYLRDSVTMAWGALTGDQALFRDGVRRFRLALEQMRPDGSLPLETDRGAMALFYQRHAIGSLVTIAEIAAHQGYDLYALENAAGGDLHDMVAFLARGVIDPAIVRTYTDEVQDLSFLTERGHDRHYMAWLEPYQARFPESAAAADLRRAMNAATDAPLPLLDDYAGGMTTCFFRPISKASP